MSEVVDQLWPVILIIAVMVTVQWAIKFHMGAGRAEAYILPGYLVVVAAGAGHVLYDRGDIQKVRVVRGARPSRRRAYPRAAPRIW